MLQPTSADLAFALAAFAGALAQSVTGFGFMLMTLTGAALVMPVEVALPAALPLAIVSASTVAWRERRVADQRLLWRRILPVMAVFAAVGFALAGALSGALLRRILGVVVLAAVASGLLRRGRAPAPWPASLRYAAVAVAGVLQGMLGTGGPVLVLALERMGLPATVFRATLVSVWPVLNVAIVAGFLIDGRLDASALLRIALALPATAAGIAVGVRVHSRLSPERFRLVVYAVLTGAAIALLGAS